MDTWKSRVDVDFYVDLLSNVLADAYRSYPDLSSVDMLRDLKTLKHRIASEGLEFLTKTLPKLGKACLTGLETGQLIVPREFARKSKRGTKWNIPRLFSALFSTIFKSDGTLDPECKNPAVGEIRQLCFLCYKLEIPHTPEQVEACELKYKKIESELPTRQEMAANIPLSIIRKARYLLRRLFDGFDPADITPRHGPGAVADEDCKGREKYVVRFYSQALDQCYPYSSYATFGRHTQNTEDFLAPYKLPRTLPPAKVVLVPKDSRGPRVISCEPALLQYMQQGLARKIVDHVERHKLTRASVHFTDQQYNRDAALRSSKDGRLATIDLADASDRVSVDLVEMLFPERLLPYLLATRSVESRLPSGEVIRLKKFAPMGSALCFPIEALTFWAITAATLWDVRRITGPIRSRLLVYGDDIIIPSQYFDPVVKTLEAFGLKVNFDKCFLHGKFRESCGCDAYNGVDVTPVKIRVVKARAHKSLIADVCRLSENAKNFFDRGYWSTADYLWKVCESVVGKIPTMGPNFQGLARSSTILPACQYIPKNVRKRWNDRLQRWEIRTRVLKAREEYSPFVDSVHRLVHNLLEGVPIAYSDCVAVPHSALPKYEWAIIQ